MKKLALTAIAGALALAACSDNSADTTTPAADDATQVENVQEPAVPVEGAVATTPDTQATDGDSVTISKDGVQADVGDGDTQVKADVDGDPSLTVKDGN